MEWDRGPAGPILTLLEQAPLSEYKNKPNRFRLEWGPIYYRGHLDESAKVLVIGQDPAPDENVARRILVGDAGQRVQGFLAKLGVTRSYVMVNSVLYSIYGQFDGEMSAFMDMPSVTQWRNQLLDVLAEPWTLRSTPVRSSRRATSHESLYVIFPSGFPHGWARATWPYVGQSAGNRQSSGRRLPRSASAVTSISKGGQVRADTIFDERRVADTVNDEQWGGVIPYEDWINMITANPAKALALQDHIGNLKAGLKADVTVLKSKDVKPARILLRTHLQDVEMVWVGGKLLYGDEPVVEKVKKGQCEQLKVHGAAKRVRVRDPNDQKDKIGQTLSDIRGALHGAYSGLAPLAP